MTQTPTRERLLDSAERLLRTIGLARTTTKEIARAAQCSEAALYKYFSSKEDLFVAVLHERLPSLMPLLAELTARPGSRTPEQALTEIARTATLFYEANMPIAASLFAEPGLLQRHREGLRPLGAGPQQPLLALARYPRRRRRCCSGPASSGPSCATSSARAGRPSPRARSTASPPASPAPCWAG
jgi:AcrR family transcriptional regulator